MQPKVARVITRIFPAKGGEDSFLPLELEALAEEYHVEIFPCNPIKGETHALPENVTVNEGLAVFASKGRVRATFALLALSRFWKLLVTPKSIHWKAREISELRDLLIGKSFFTNLAFDPRVRAAYSWWSYGLGLGALLGHPTETRKFAGLNGDDFQQSSDPSAPYSHIEFATNADKSLHFIGRSSFASEQFRHLYGIDQTRSSTVYLKVAGPKSVPPQNRSDRLFRTVSCSNDARVKRLDLMIESLCVLADRNPNTFFEHKHLGTLGSAEANCSSQVPNNLMISQTGWISHERIMEEYSNNQFDAFLHFSAYEGGVPVAMIEAASFNIPLVGFRSGGVPEICSSSSGHLFGCHPTPILIAIELEGFIAKLGAKSILPSSRLAWEAKFSSSKSFEIAQLILGNE